MSLTIHIINIINIIKNININKVIIIMNHYHGRS